MEISIEDFLNGKYENQYVKIKESVQVADTDLSKTWADPAGKSHFSINMETADGKVFVVFTSSYCGQLKNTQVAQGSGQICGIASINNGTYQLIFAKATDADALNGDRFTAQIHVLTVDKALAARNVLASVSGRVIAACAEGVVINDGSANNLYVYNASYKTKPFEFNVGDIVKADGSLTTYCKVAELKVDAEKALTADLAIEETPAQVTTVITPENIATWLPSPAGSAKVSVSGKLVISGSYINLEIDGATIQGSIKTSKDLASFNGKYVSCTGYWIGTTNKYFTIVETEITEDTSDRLSVSTKELNVAANATSASFDIASTVAWKVTSKTEGVTVDPTSGNGDATITLTFAENTSDQPKVYTIEVSSALGTETITLTQKAPAAGGDPVYTLDTALEVAKGKDNSYSNSEDIVVGEVTWNVTGNSTMAPWRIGGKTLDKVDREVYTKTAYSSALSKIVLTCGKCDVTNISGKLVYSTNSDFSSATEKEFTVPVNSSVSIEADFPKDCYYKFVFNITVEGGSKNKFFEFSKVEFYK